MIDAPTERAATRPGPAREGVQGARPTVVCMTPVKDEAWILRRFLECAALWADIIVVADQGSTDGSREIAAAHPKVCLVDNPSAQFGEVERQRLLIDTARALVPGPRLLLGLDADEALTGNFTDSPEWRDALASPPGTVLTFQWVNLQPDLEHCWIPDWEFPWGYVDDGAAHEGPPIHGLRVPVPAGANRRRMRDVKVLHYAHTDMDRVRSRNRWYQCWERLHHDVRTPVGYYRQYHQFGQVDVRRRIEPAWTAAYRAAGIDMTSVQVDGRYRWDALVLDMLREHGAEPFRRLDVWDVDWRALARLHGRDPGAVPADPRTPLDRAVLSYLRRSQGRQDRMPWFHIDRLLGRLGW